MTPTYSVVARIYNPAGDRLTALVERRVSEASARSKAASLRRSTKAGDRSTWPDGVAKAVDGVPDFVDFSVIDRIEYEEVTT